MKSVVIKGKKYDLPIFLPDATRAVVKASSSKDVENANIKGAVVNTYHLMTTPGISVLKEYGGIKNFMNFEGLITSDSGGWQIFSLIHRDKKPGKITDKGVTFNFGGKNSKKTLFTPEKSIQTQFAIGSDIIVCLDDFTNPNANTEEIKHSVDRTILWAKKCKEEFNRLVEQNKMNDSSRPLLMAVVQGGLDKSLRKECYDRLAQIDFDAYGFGGYVVDENGVNMEISEYLASLLPDNKIKFALGNGMPVEIAKMYKHGWNIFDCTLPTRDARNKRLYNFTKVPTNYSDLTDPTTYDYIYINREKYVRDKNPISQNCDCFTCKNYSRGYLNHLFKIEDTSALRLATIHNLRTYARLMEYIKKFSDK